jgi:hypothetical protein
VLDALREAPQGIPVKRIARVVDGHTAAVRAALVALEKGRAVEKVPGTTPTSYRITDTGDSVTSLRRAGSTVDELKVEIVQRLGTYKASDGLSLDAVLLSLGYSDPGSRSRGSSMYRTYGDIFRNMVETGELQETKDGRYTLPGQPAPQSAQSAQPAQLGPDTRAGRSGP